MSDIIESLETINRIIYKEKEIKLSSPVLASVLDRSINNINPIDLNGSKIGNYAFAGAENLEQIDFSNSIIELGSYSFFKCNNLTKIEIPANIEVIGDYGFSECEKLTLVNILGNIKKISRGCFCNDANLTWLTLPENLEEIGEDAFRGCVNLDGDIELRTTEIVIKDGAFMNCENLSAIICTGQVINIGNGAFANCNKIAAYDFRYCKTIPPLANALSLGHSSGCVITVPQPLYEEWIVSDGWKDVEDVIWNPVIIPTDVSLFTFSGGTITGYNGPDTEIIIPTSYSLSTAGTPVIGEDVPITSLGTAFNGNVEIMKVFMQDNITSIANSAFSGCTSLEEVVLSNSIEVIPNYAFGSCSSLKSIEIPESVTSIQANAFRLSGLETITIPANVTTIGTSLFNNCTSLTNVNIEPGLTVIPQSTFEGDQQLKTVNIPNTVTSIGNYAFSNCRALTSIIIPDSVTSIAANAFYYCQAATELKLPNNITTLPARCFAYCSGLTSVTIPEGVTEIAQTCFGYCSAITSINLPESLITIGNEAFGAIKGLTEITIPKNVTSIGQFAFYVANSAVVRIESKVLVDGTNTSVFATSVPLLLVPASKYNDYKAYTIFSRLTAVMTGFETFEVGAELPNYADGITYNKTVWYSDVEKTQVVTSVETAGDYYCEFVYEEVESETITFTINGIEYTAMEGMTWGEWLNSEFNTENFWLQEYDGYICFENEAVLYPGTANCVLNTEVIDSSIAYILSTSPDISGGGDVSAPEDEF